MDLLELKRWVGFDDDDGARLRRLRPHVAARTDAIVGRFYDAAVRFDGARAVLGDAARQARLRATLAVWLDEMLSGPWDAAWVERRRRIGDVHVKVGLPSHYMFTAMNVVVDACVEVAEECCADDRVAVGRALRRVADLELAVMVGSYIDTRERRELDHLSHLLFAHLPTSVLLLDEHGRVLASTLRAGLHTPAAGEADLDAVLDKVLVDAVGLAGLIDAAHASGVDQSSGHVEVVDKGQRRVVRATAVPLGHLRAHTLVHLEDLTATMSAELRAQQAEHLAHLGTMAASVAHEIRNPLAGISGTVQVIGSSLPEGDPRRRALDKVLEQVQRLGALVGDLLGFARPITAVRVDVDLVAVAKDAVKDADAVAKDGHATVVEGAGHALADAGLVRQVLQNLIENAWQAGASSVVVRVGDGSVDVVDDGPGIAKDVGARVFEPFFTTRTRGTGLGLPVSLRMAEAMGGALRLSPTTSGATFALRLPVEPPRSDR